MDEPLQPDVPAENKFDAEKLRAEVLRIKSMGLDELRQYCLEQEYSVYAIQAKYDATLYDMLDKIQTSPDVRKEYGRSFVPTIMTTTSKWLQFKGQLAFLREELAFKEREAANQRQPLFAEDLKGGIVGELTGGKGEGGPEGAKPTTE